MALSSRLALRNAPQACIRKRNNRVDDFVEEQSHPLLRGKVRTTTGPKSRSETSPWTRRGTGAREYSQHSSCGYSFNSGSSRNCLNTIHNPVRTNSQRLDQYIRNSNQCFRTSTSSTIFPAGRNIHSQQICRRCFTSRSSPLWNATQEAPNAKAYLNSGAIAGARDLVDVKKVLVIGSGGLAIGQAGEFDYSGKPFLCLDMSPCLGVLDQELSNT